MLYSTVYAISETGSIFEAKMDFGEFILLTISLFVLAAGLLSILFILWGGLLLILSGGKDDKIKPAINTIRFAVIGVVVTVLTIFLFPVFGRLLGLDVEKYAKPQRIFQKIEEIGNKIFGSSSDSSSNFNTTQPESLDDFPADFSDL
ncbi:hypothetical protein GW846_04900 [Candidatus Gracilibacteria bacterium]|nr:hypothetical protein [Candidatus Gracilibacteria bacterium]